MRPACCVLHDRGYTARDARTTPVREDSVALRLLTVNCHGYYLQDSVMSSMRAPLRAIAHRTSRARSSWRSRVGMRIAGDYYYHHRPTIDISNQDMLARLSCPDRPSSLGYAPVVPCAYLEACSTGGTPADSPIRPRTRRYLSLKHPCGSSGSSHRPEGSRGFERSISLLPLASLLRRC